MHSKIKYQKTYGWSLGMNKKTTLYVNVCREKGGL